MSIAIPRSTTSTPSAAAPAHAAYSPLALLAAGVGAALMLPGPVRRLLGGALLLGGGAALARAAYRSRTAARAATEAPEPTGPNHGEGDPIAARHYAADVREFVAEGRVAPAARSAATAVDGPEGPGLRAAEELGKTSPTRRPS